MLANGPTRFTMADHRGSHGALGMNMLLGFFSTKVLRGGPRILLYLALFLATVLSIFRWMPEGLSDLAFGSISTDIGMGFWGWSDKNRKQGLSGDENAAYGAAKKLRVVAFGADDIATPADGPWGNDTAGWSEALCRQLGCSRYMSMIPPVSGLSHPFVSNELYSLAVEKALNESIHLGDEPGYNYDFLSEQYPVLWNLQDLSEQVTEFLSMPKPKVSPDETLWVFSVGAWDIWSLAALPLEISEGIVGQLSYFLFEQIERLYQSSLDPKSIAWSTNRYIGETASKEVGELPLESEGTNTTALNATADATEPVAATPMFRILIPKVFDPSLTPGWHSDRPLAPEVHSRAEQMRNAARLTQQWNQAIDIRMNVWVKSAGANPVTGVGNAADGSAQLAPPLANPPLAGRPSPVMGTPSTTSAAPAASPSATEDSAAPLRDGFIYNLPEYIMKVIVDRQFRNAGLEDANGIGSELDTTSYVQVWEPCVGAEDEDEDDETEESDDGEEDGESIVFVSEGMRNNNLPRRTPQIRGRSAEPVPEPRNATSAKGDSAVAESICSTPDNYLFFTTFTLSRRAIAEIAWEAADLVLKNETVRARIARIGMPI